MDVIEPLLATVGGLNVPRLPPRLAGDAALPAVLGFLAGIATMVIALMVLATSRSRRLRRVQRQEPPSHLDDGEAAREAPGVDIYGGPDVYESFVQAAEDLREQPADVRVRHRERLLNLGVTLSTVVPIIEEHPRTRSHHYRDALDDVRLRVLDLSHFLGLDRDLADLGPRNLARGLWKDIDTLIEGAATFTGDEADAHALRVGATFTEASRHLIEAARDFTGADLARADLGDVDLPGLLWDEATRWPPGWARRIRESSGPTSWGAYVVGVVPPDN